MGNGFARLPGNLERLQPRYCAGWPGEQHLRRRGFDTRKQCHSLLPDDHPVRMAYSGFGDTGSRSEPAGELAYHYIELLAATWLSVEQLRLIEQLEAKMECIYCKCPGAKFYGTASDPDAGSAIVHETYNCECCGRLFTLIFPANDPESWLVENDNPPAPPP